jgi:hypothetical protein
MRLFPQSLCLRSSSASASTQLKVCLHPSIFFVVCAGQNAGGVLQTIAADVVAPAGGNVIGMTAIADQVTVSGNKG